MAVWWTARGAGLAALLVLTLATAGGALQATRLVGPAGRVVLQYAHRAAAAAGLALVALHVTAVVLDGDAGVGLLGALVPFTAGYRPVPVALGTLALYALVAVAALGAARRRAARSARGAAVWRLTHLLAYPAWAVAVLHGLTTGTDAGTAWAAGSAGGCAGLVLLALAARLVGAARPLAHRPPVHPTPEGALR